MFELINKDGETLGLFDSIEAAKAEVAELAEVGIWTDILDAA